MNGDNRHIVNYDLVAKYLDNSASAVEKEIVENWVEHSFENQKEFNRLKHLWKRTKAAKYNAEPAWNKLKSRMGSTTIPEITETKISTSNTLTVTSKKTKSKNLSLWYKIAASIVLLLAVYKITDIYLFEEPHKYIASTTNIIKDTLPDKTLITLNKNSELEYSQSFSKKERRVKLKGEAFFKVKRNEKKPFVVEVNKCEVTVLGTSFNVKDCDTVVEVSVKSGKVKIYRKNRKNAYVILVAGEKGSINNITGDINKTNTNTSKDIDWITKTLVFEDTPLSVVFRTIEKLHNIKIKVADSSIYNYILTTTFEDMDIPEMFDIICATFNLEYTFRNSIVEVKKTTK